MTSRVWGSSLVFVVSCGTLEIGSNDDASAGMAGQSAGIGASSQGGSSAAAGAPGETAGQAGAAISGGSSGGGTAGYGAGGSAGDAAGAGGAPEAARVVEIATSTSHNCARLSDGRARCWGADIGSGALGLARGLDLIYTIGDDETPASAGDVDVGGRVTQLSAGDFSTCALFDNGRVRCWGGGFGLGYPNRMNIGDDEPPSAADFVDVGGPVQQIATAAHRSCAVLENGAVRCWGLGEYGALGYGNVETVGDDEAPASVGDVPVGGPVAEIAMGFDHTCAVLRSGALRCWGNGRSGVLGYGNTDNIGDDETPAEAGDVDVGGPVRHVAASLYATCAVLVDGAVRCWGEWAPLQLDAPAWIGDDETPGSVPPIEVGGTVLSVSVGVRRACAVLDGGRARCWGDGPHVPLGYGNLQYIGDDEPPAAAGDLQLGGPVVQIGAESRHICALLQNGDVRCWGGVMYAEVDQFGMLPLGIPFLDEPIGDDEFPDRFDPVQILDP